MRYVALSLAFTVILPACSQGQPSTPESLAKEYQRAIDSQDEQAMQKLIFFAPEASPADRKTSIAYHLAFKTFGLESVQPAALSEQDKDETSFVRDRARYVFEPAPTGKLLRKTNTPLPEYLVLEPPFVGVRDGRYYVSMPHKSAPRPPEFLVGKLVELAKANAATVIDADLPERQRVRGKEARYVAELGLYPEQIVKQLLDSNHTAAIAVLQTIGSGPFQPTVNAGVKQSTAYKGGPHAWAKAYATLVPETPIPKKATEQKQMDANALSRAVKLTKSFGAITREIEALSQKIMEAKANGAFDAKGNWNEFWQFQQVQRLGGLDAVDRMIPSAYIAAIQQRLDVVIDRDKAGKATDDDARWVDRLLDMVSGEHGLQLGYTGQTAQERASLSNSRLAIFSDYLIAITRHLEPPRGR